LFLFGELTARRGSVTGFGRFGRIVLTYHTTEASSAAGIFSVASSPVWR
ncbi:hypothetical protein T06_7677, partial [Trichinella sp. T6]